MSEEALTLSDLRGRDVEHSDSISAVLDDLARQQGVASEEDFLDRVAAGVAFVTFAYDIDGVSMEIAKYGACLEKHFAADGRTIPVHLVGGNFAENADVVLDPAWQRHKLDGADGWGKWDHGKWFAQMFLDDMPEESETSRDLAVEIWHQALDLSERLTTLIRENDIGLIWLTNVNSNPGNMAFALATVLASEATGCAVLNNNHDFYWEGGKARCKRADDEEAGPRDHFFRNHDNRSFFAVFQRLLPWNGRRWVQVNINPAQSRRLIDAFHFPPDRIFTIGTAIDPEFFEPVPDDYKTQQRARMARVLSDGHATILPVPVDSLLDRSGDWMRNQKPVVVGADGGLELDITRPDALYLLQPTRVVGRKRIWRGVEMVRALLEHAPFREHFWKTPDATLTIHVSGPVPIEHERDFQAILRAYRDLELSVPADLGYRIFLAFSVGHQTHPVLERKGIGGLHVADIYRLADAVLFPSYTEGRGLPIPESAAVGVPILCSRYHPEKVYAAVIGEDLAPEDRILVDEFPEDAFPPEFLDQVTRILFSPEALADRTAHNREAVRRRYSLEGLQASMKPILDRLEWISTH